VARSRDKTSALIEEMTERCIKHPSKRGGGGLVACRRAKPYPLKRNGEEDARDEQDKKSHDREEKRREKLNTGSADEERQAVQSLKRRLLGGVGKNKTSRLPSGDRKAQGPHSDKFARNSPGGCAIAQMFLNRQDRTSGEKKSKERGLSGAKRNVGRAKAGCWVGFCWKVAEEEAQTKKQPTPKHEKRVQKKR